MREKYNEKYEKQIRELAGNRITAGQYKVFDSKARIVGRERFPGLVEQGTTADANCLVVVNSAGDTLVITAEFERELLNVSRSWLE